MALLEARNLTKRFGDFTAVDHVTLVADRAEVVGFLGPNGAGKTTTMRMIAGFLEPEEGTVRLAGHDLAAEPIAAKQTLGYLPEGAPAYGEMCVADFLDFVGRIRGLSGARLKARLADMAETVNLAEVWSQPIETLSKGYKRRVGIAQALIHDPEILILDEPTDGLDPNQKHEMRGLIRRIAARKVIVISTHLLEEVEAVCTRTVIIAEGRVLVDDTPDALLMRAARPGAMEVLVRLNGAAPETVAERLRPMIGATAVEVIGRTNGQARLMLVASENEAPGTIAAAISGAGIEIEEIVPHRPRLDDVFREVTGGRAC